MILRRGLLILWAAFAFPAFAKAEEITVFAAASLQTALDSIAADWQEATGNVVNLSYAGTPQLANQIEQGAPADIFVAASEDWMDVLQDAGLIIPGSRVDLLGNSLVLVAHGADAAPIVLDPDLDFTVHLGGSRLAMALIDSVPVGVYGKQALVSLGLWENAEPHVVQTENARTTLALVVRGETALGIVYLSDAIAALAAEEELSIMARFPATSHDPIRYPAALIKDQPAAAAFLDHLSSPMAAKVFREQGFVVLN
jgi:molybdate transport system substrate-binding protein